ncbi:MAG TPA: hypothetical protein EYM36_07820 [Acidobacteria bacterium]|nr:hypothetical protein [Acidobacteriota bacterium]
MQSTTREGRPSVRPHPAIGAGVRAGSELRPWAVQLGLTPASRAKVSTSPAETMSTFEAFAARRTNAGQN